MYNLCWGLHVWACAALIQIGLCGLVYPWGGYIRIKMILNVNLAIKKLREKNISGLHILLLYCKSWIWSVILVVVCYFIPWKTWKCFTGKKLWVRKTWVSRIPRSDANCTHTMQRGQINVTRQNNEACLVSLKDTSTDKKCRIILLLQKKNWCFPWESWFSFKSWASLLSYVTGKRSASAEHWFKLTFKDISL